MFNLGMSDNFTGFQDPEIPSITLEDGSVVTINCAHCRGRSTLHRRRIHRRPMRSGYAPGLPQLLLSLLIPATEIEEDPATRAWAATWKIDPRQRMYELNKDILVGYPCREYVGVKAERRLLI
jgi:hypothetical protein